MATSALAAARRRSVLLRLAAIAAIAGTLDIGDSILFNATRGVTPAMIFRFIAAGLVGPAAARHWGAATVALGVAIHYAIALAWTLLFYLLSRRLVALVRHPWLWGPVYGAFAYLVMNVVVLPLTRLPPLPPVSWANRLNGVLALLVCIGLAIALLTRSWLPASTMS